MAKEKAPYMPFYGREFYLDLNVMVMTLAQEGAYHRLAWMCWQEGSIPSSLDKLAAICKNTPVETFRQDIWPALSGLFIDGPDGSLTHKKVEDLRAKKDKFRAECSAAGKRGAAKRWSNKGSDGVAMGYPTSTPSSQNGVGMATEYRIPNTEETLSARVEENALASWGVFQAAYPEPKRNVRVEASCRAYVGRIGVDPKKHKALMDGLQRHVESEQWRRSLADDGGRYIPSMEKFIAEGLYVDHPVKAEEPKRPKFFDASYLKAGSDD